jgi:hypothetical protein
LSKALAAWSRFFYPGGSAIAYSAFGCAYYSYLLVMAVLSPLSKPWGLEPIFISDLAGFRLLHLSHPSFSELAAIIHVWWVILFLCAAGFLGKPMRILCFLVGTYICGQKQNMGLVFDQESTLMLGLIVLTVAPAFPVTPLSLVRSRGKISPATAAEVSWRYSWPLQLLKLVLVYIMFSAGLLKLYFGGFYWLTQNVVYAIATDPEQHRRAGVVVEFMARHESLCRVFTILGFLLELSFPLILFSKTLRPPLLAAAFSMLLGIWILIRIHFAFYMAPLFLAFLPWEKMRRLLDEA